MSRAFVKEGDAESVAARDDAEHIRKTEEWLKIQKKKLHYLENDPRAAEMEPAKRERWLMEARSAVEEAERAMQSSLQ